MSTSINKSFKIGYSNLRAQTGLVTTKQAQVEHSVKKHKYVQHSQPSFEIFIYITGNYNCF